MMFQFGLAKERNFIDVFHQNLTSWHRETGLSPPVIYFADPSKAILLLWIFYVFFCLVFAMPLCASVFMCLVVTCWERALGSCLWCLTGNFVTFPLAS